MIEHLTNSGIQLGLTAEQSKLCATHTVIGAGQLALSSKDSASQLREKVTSKGGTTFAALEILNQRSWGLALEDAVKAATLRAKEMGDDFSKK
jgi:pyrroline-5-carboxylate reductase